MPRKIVLNPRLTFNMAHSPSHVDISSDPVPDNWLDQLLILVSTRLRTLYTTTESAQSCSVENVVANIAKKARDFNYPALSMLIDNLKIIYRRLNKDFDESLGALDPDSRDIIVIKLSEESHECTAGYHNRLTEITLGFKLITSFNELLQNVRLALVDRVANQLSDNVHDHNHVYTTAFLEGYGTPSKNILDPYRIGTPTEEIKRALKREFELEYNPFNLIQHIVHELKTLLRFDGYEGQWQYNDNGYSVPVATRLFEKLKKLLSPSILDEMLFSFETIKVAFCCSLDSDMLPEVIHDINWAYITDVLLKKLCSPESPYLILKEEIPSKPQECLELIEWAYRSHTLPLEVRTSLIRTQSQRFDWLTMLFHAGQIISFIEKEKDLRPLIWEKLIEWMLLAERESIFCATQLTKVIAILLNENQIPAQKKLTFIRQCHQDPETILNCPIINFIAMAEALLNSNCISSAEEEIIINLLCYQNQQGLNIFLYAAKYQPVNLYPSLRNLVGALLRRQNHSADLKARLLEALLKCDIRQASCFCYASWSNTKALKDVFQLFDLLADGTDPCRAINQLFDLLLFNHSNNMNCIELAICHDPDAAEQIVKKIYSLVTNESITPEQRLKAINSFCRTDSQHRTLLMKASLFQPKSVISLLKALENLLMSPHLSSKEKSDLTKMIVATDYIKFNFLMYLFDKDPHLFEFSIDLLIRLIKSTETTPEQKAMLADIFLSKNFKENNILTHAILNKGEVRIIEKLMEAVIELLRSMALSPYHKKRLLTLFDNSVSSENLNILMLAARENQACLDILTKVIKDHILLETTPSDERQHLLSIFVSNNRENCNAVMFVASVAPTSLNNLFDVLLKILGSCNVTLEQKKYLLSVFLQTTRPNYNLLTLIFEHCPPLAQEPLAIFEKLLTAQMFQELYPYSRIIIAETLCVMLPLCNDQLIALAAASNVVSRSLRSIMYQLTTNQEDQQDHVLRNHWGEMLTSTMGISYVESLLNYINHDELACLLNSIKIDHQLYLIQNLNTSVIQAADLWKQMILVRLQNFYKRYFASATHAPQAQTIYCQYTVFGAPQALINQEAILGDYNTLHFAVQTGSSHPRLTSNCQELDDILQCHNMICYLTNFHKRHVL